MTACVEAPRSRWRLAAIGLAILLALLGLLPRSASADAGTIEGRAATAEGSLAVLPVGLNSITLPLTGDLVQANLPLTLGVGADLVVGDLTIGVSADSVRTECEGAPTAGTVWSECVSKIEGLSIGASLELLGGLVTTDALILEASVLESRSRSSAPGGVPGSSSSGTTIAGLCIYSDGSTCAAVNGQALVNVSVLGAVTGSVQVFAEQSRTSDGGVEGSGLTVTMIGIELATVLGSLASLDIGVADSFVGGVTADIPPATTPIPEEPTETPEAPETPPAVAPTSTPTPAGSAPGTTPAPATPTAVPTQAQPGTTPAGPPPPPPPAPFGSPPAAPFAEPTPAPNQPEAGGTSQPGPTATPAKPGGPPNPPASPTFIPKPPRTGDSELADGSAGTALLLAGAFLLVIGAAAGLVAQKSR